MEVERREKIRLVGKIDFQDLMRCALDLTALDVAVYFELLNGEATVKKLSDKLSRNRSTIQRALTNLISKGLAIREPKTMKNGGYYFEYRAIPLKQVKKTIRQKVREWYTKMSFFLKEKLLDYKSSG